MPKTDTLNLVALLSNGMADAIASESFYNDTMVELAQEDWTTNAIIVALTKGKSEKDLSGTAFVNLKGFIYDDSEIDLASQTEIESIDSEWRDAVGRTTSYIIEDGNVKTIALYPAPDLPSNPDLGLYGEPLGLDYPTYSGVLFYSYPALDPLQPQYYLELIIALRVLNREFTRESDHIDSEFATVAQTLMSLFKGML